MDISEVRNLFPYLNNNLIYLNHASTGPVSARVLNQINDFLTEKSERKIDDYKSFLRITDETKSLIGKMINSDSDRIAFVENTSTGLNILAQGLNWNEGDRIILNNIEFPANVYPFLNLQKKRVIIDFIKSENGIVTSDEIINAITPDTKLISISFVQFLSGYKINLDELGKICKEKDIIFSIDAIQGLGAVNLDVQKSYIDFISCGTQKWLLGLQGLGFIYVSEELQKKLSPAYAGWLSVQNAWNLLDYNLNFRKAADRFQTGTMNAVGIYALNASLKLFFDFGIKKIEDLVINNSKYLIEELKKINVDPILKNCPEKNMAGIISFYKDNAERIVNQLAGKDIICAARENIVRFSPHFYNTKEEIDKAVFELNQIIN